ncbi:MAG: OmpA family protein [Candidatus Kapabacteria bacterium]|nr:OmpA family protein [Candidatus Kapabacteria bacterium]
MGSYSLNLHNADFRAFPNVPSCCPRYENGSGNGIGFGVLYQMPLVTDLRLALRASYSGLSGNLEREESGVLSGGVTGNFMHQVQSSLADIGIEPIIQYRLVNNVWAGAGMRLGYLMTRRFSQKEQIQTPGFLFTNGRTIRNEVNSAPIPLASTLLGSAVAQVGYDLRLNTQGTLVLAPELSYVLPLTNLVQGLDWKVSQVRFGAALKWSPLPAKEPIKREEQRRIIDTVRQETEPVLAGYRQGIEQRTESITETDDEILTLTTIRRTDTLRVASQPSTKKYALSATVSASGLYDDGRETPTVKLEVEEFSSVLMTPLLPYVFFDENSSDIPSRYKLLTITTRERFKEERVNNPDRLATYYHILNIIGKRMRQNPDAVLTVTGCNADIGSEKSNLALSQQRADAVRKYLLDVWELPEARVKVEARNIPAKAANALTSDGAQENRRVELSSNSAAIVAPLITNDTLKTVTPPSVRFRSKVLHDNDIASWKLQATQDNSALKTFDGTGEIPDVLDWNVNIEKGTQPLTNSDIVYTLAVTDTRSEKVESKNSLPVQQITIKKKKAERIGDKEIQRFSLILFDVRSDEITPANKQIVNIIKPYITPASTVRITGYTDRLGDAQQNQILAEARAANTSKELGVKDNSEQVQGKGNATLYDANLPEGRLYTRTVDIVIETKLNE